MSQLIIQGGNPLKGTATPVPNKNSIIKLIPAAVLTDAPVILHNVPKTSDVQYMLEIFEQLGGQAKWTDTDVIYLDASGIGNHVIDPVLSQKMKASVMYAGPLLARLGRVSMPLPQGCKLGTRPMDTFIENMVAMGCSYKKDGLNYDVHTSGLQATRLWQRFPSVTGTENAIMMAVLAKGTTQLYNAACEPHVQDLCNMLVSMGAQIDGIGSNKLTITGVERLQGTEWTVISDHIGVGGLIAAALLTEGELTIKDAIVDHMYGILQTYRKLGATIEVDRTNDTIFVPQQQDLHIVKKNKGSSFDLKALQRPLFPPDLVHTAVVVALKAEGQAIFHNLMYEYGWFFVQELAKMKANILMANPVTVITQGPTTFAPANLVSSDIIQAAYALVLACLAAPGKSTITAVKPLFRRFPHLVEEFNALGADITLVD